MKRGVGFVFVFLFVTIFSTKVLAFNSYSGWWYVKGEPGDGVSIEIQGDRCFVAIFDYEYGDPFWLSSYGEVEDLAIEPTLPLGLHYQGDLYLWNGWPLGSEYFEPVAFKIGAMIIDFESESQADLTYSISKEYLSGDSDITMSVHLTRFMPDISPGTPDPRDINGWWFDPSFNGMGFYLEAYGNTVFMAWYHYGNLGQPWWRSCYSSFSPTDTEFSCTLQEWAGGSPLGSDSYKPPVPSDKGLLTFRLTGESTAEMTWQGTTYHLQRFVFGN